MCDWPDMISISEGSKLYNICDVAMGDQGKFVVAEVLGPVMQVMMGNRWCDRTSSSCLMHLRVVMDNVLTEVENKT